MSGGRQQREAASRWVASIWTVRALGLALGATLLLPWYSVERPARLGPRVVDAWQAYGHAGLALCALALAAVLAGCFVARRWSWPVEAACGAAALVLAASGALRHPAVPPAPNVPQDSASLVVAHHVLAGPFAACLAALALLGAALVARRRAELDAQPVAATSVGAIVATVGAIDSVTALLRHAHLQTGLDVTIFDQAVWHYSRFEAPYSSIKAENLLGDHFHPLVAALAPLYWLWSSAGMLLLAQALLAALSVVPVYLFARPRLGERGALLLAAAYALFWGIQVGVIFEFHEVAFAPLLIALAILLADRRRWGWLALTVLLLLGVKEDMGFLVAFLGIYLLSLRHVRAGLAALVTGIVAYEVITRVAIPHFAGRGTDFQYWTFGQLGATPQDAIWALVKAPWRVATIGLSPSTKATTLVALLAPFLFLSLFSRVAILLVPLLAERFLSTTQAFWGMHFHYSMAVAPVLAMSAACGLANLSAWCPEHLRRRVVLGAGAAMLAVSVAITGFSTGDSAVAQITSRGTYQAPTYESAVHRLLAHVPPTASFAASTPLIAHAGHRNTVGVLGFPTPGAPDYVAINVGDLACCGTAGGSSLGLELEHLTPVYYGAGWMLAQRPPGGAAPTNGVLAPMASALARRIDVAYVPAERALAAAGALHACTPERGCLATLRRFHRAESGLGAAMRGALPTLTGGCRDLGVTAVGSVDLLVRDVDRIAATLAPMATSAGIAALAAFIDDERAHDPVNAIDRFVILCQAR